MSNYTNLIKRRDDDKDITVYRWNESKYPLIILIEWEEGGENRAIEIELSAKEMTKILEIEE